MVCEAVPPTSKDPQLIEVMALVQALFENTPTFGPVETVPEDVKLWLTVTAATVKPVSAIAATVRTTTKYFEFLRIAIGCFSSPIQKLIY
jgi:hypothetical protein